jgi:hypothetical protein
MALTIGTQRENAKFEGDIHDFKHFATISKCDACAKRSEKGWNDAICWTNYLEEFQRLIKLRNSFREVVEEVLALRAKVKVLEENREEMKNL